MVEQSKDILEQIKQDAIENASILGLLYKHGFNEKEVMYHHTPMSLFPMPYPKNLLMHALKIQKPMGELIAKAICDPEFLWKYMESYMNDPLIAGLVNISKQCHADGNI